MPYIILYSRFTSSNVVGYLVVVVFFLANVEVALDLESKETPLLLKL